MSFSYEERKNRAFHRVATALFSFWEEQKDIQPRCVCVHSRIFDILVDKSYIELNQKSRENSYTEHVVPCAYIRNLSFDMFWSGRTVDDVAIMIGQLLKIAYIRREEAKYIDYELGYKDEMPEGWLYPEGDPLIRLKLANLDVNFQ
jgi:hypothetical protein